MIIIIMMTIMIIIIIIIIIQLHYIRLINMLFKRKIAKCKNSTQ